MDAYNIFESQWKKISEAIPGKTEFQCIQRWEMLQNEQLTIWTREEDEQLIQLVLKYGEDWKQLALIMKNKIQTQIETRFIDLNIIFNSQPWNEEEEDNKLLDLFDQYGTKWNQIAKLMKDRSEIEVKYRYYTKHKISDNQMTLNLKISDSEFEKQEELEIKTFKTEVKCKQELQNIEPQPNKKVNIQQSEQYILPLVHFQDKYSSFIVQVVSLLEFQVLQLQLESFSLFSYLLLFIIIMLIQYNGLVLVQQLQELLGNYLSESLPTSLHLPQIFENAQSNLSNDIKFNKDQLKLHQQLLTSTI